MKYLIIESSTERGMVALFEDSRLLNHIELPAGFQNSRFLLPALSTLLNSQPIDFVVVGVGPGSYTGIRVGAAAAKSIAYARKIPLVGICTLESFIPEESGSFAAIIDAKIGGIYLLRGEKFGEDVAFHNEPMLCDISKANEYLANVSLLCTPNADIIKPRIEAVCQGKSWVWKEMSPNPEAMAKKAREKIRKNEFTTNCTLDLLYLRKTQAEIEREQNLNSMQKSG